MCFAFLEGRRDKDVLGSLLLAMLWGVLLPCLLLYLLGMNDSDLSHLVERLRASIL